VILFEIRPRFSNPATTVTAVPSIELSGVKLATSDAHRGLVKAIGAALPAAAWQRCRTHRAANLISATPKTQRGWMKAMLHSVYAQPDADAVRAQFDRVCDTLSEKLPALTA
jgi:transposase-like protein